MGLVNSLIYYFILAIARISALLPWPIISLIAKVISWIWYYLIPFRKSLIIENISLAFPEKSAEEVRRITRANLTHYCLLVLESLQLGFLSQKELLEKIAAFQNPGAGLKAYKEGKGLLILTAHIGNFEWMPAVAPLYGFNFVHIIAKPLRNPVAERLIQSTRGRWVKLITSKDGFHEAFRLLKNNEIIGVMLDQHRGGNGAVWIDFFNRPAGTMKYLAVLAERTGAPVVPVKNVRLPDGKLLIEFDNPIPFERVGSVQENIRHNTELYTKRIEEWIRKCP
ncbi:MAG TPA: lysophospholipid acyltransferase family protein, partial [Bdellovibrionota bacterium]|nr:lysophospholipid acyltransferase family protein [Bdellovibrionota bacterium]